MRGKKWIVAGLLLVVTLVTAGVLWTQKDRLQAWYALRGLAQAEEATREPWIERITALGDYCVDSLFDQIHNGDERTRDNAVAAIDHLARMHGPANSRTADYASRLSRSFGEMSMTSKAVTLHYLSGWFTQDKPAANLVPSMARMLTESAAVMDVEVQVAGLELASILVRQPEGELALSAARSMAAAGLGASSPKVRLRAIQVCMQPNIDLLDRVVGLLRDSSVEVRRAAVLAVGSVESVVREDGLLPGLHDSDEEVRRLTESALKGRGLRPEQLELGRLLTHPKATTRIQVLDRVMEVLDNRGSDLDIDPGVWLRRLSHDQSPAVRAAALRMMSQQSLIDLSDRIDQMARSDPSPTVSQMARFYLTRTRNKRLPIPGIER